MSNRTNELIDLLKYIQNELVSQYPCGHITSDYFICAVIDKEDSIAHKAIVRSVMDSDLNKLREDLDTELSMNNPATLNESPEFDTKLQKIFDKFNNGNDIVSSGHILCAIIEEDESLQQKFKQMRVTPQRLLVRVLECLNENGVITPNTTTVKKTDDKKRSAVLPPMPVEPAPVRFKNENSEAEKYMTNLNMAAQNGRVPSAVNRDELYKDIFRTLSRCTKNNVILVGEGGVGKTAISKNIANFLIRDEVPRFLKGKTLLCFSLIKFFAGASMPGMLEARTKAIMEEINSKKKYIILLDDIDTIVNVSMTQDATAVITLFNNLLASSNVYVIATCSTKGYGQIITPNRQLEGLMKRVDIKKPSAEECYGMVVANKERFEKFHDVKYNDDVVKLCVDLADKHIKERSLPDSAFDIIDEVGAGISMSSTDSPELAEIIERLDQIKTQQTKINTSTNVNDYIILDELNEEERTLKSKKALLEKEANLSETSTQVTVEDVYDALSSRIGKKVERLNQDEKTRLKNISEELKSVIIGQDQAVEEVCRVVKRQRMKLFNTDKPAVLFFSGSTGTGKTYLAKQLAEKVFGDQNAIVRLDMSEYADKISVNKLYGSPSGYVGYEDGGILTEAIKNKGRCVLLLDEIEKANDEVFNVFLQVFDDGRLTDSKGVTVSFRDTIIIMTSNIGAAEAAMRGGGVGFTQNAVEMSKSVINNAIKRRFKPEFLNRIDAIVQFNKLTHEDLRKVVKLEIDKLSRQLSKSGYGLGDSFRSDRLADFILDKTEDETAYGGRAIVRAVTKYIEDNVVDYVITHEIENNHVFETNEIIPELENET